MVWPVSRGNEVRWSQMRAYTHRARLLSCREMHLAGNRTLRHVEDRRLAFKIDGLDPILELPAAHHLLEHPQALIAALPLRRHIQLALRMSAAARRTRHPSRW